MRARWTLWRTISAVVALCLLGLGAKCFVDAKKLRRQFAEWEKAKPMDAVVDLSTPGEFVAPFRQTCSASHSEAVLLRVPAEALQARTITQLLNGLSARLEILRKSDTTVVESASAGLSWSGDTIDGAFPIFFVAPFREGEYDAKVTVTAGAPALKGIAQRLEGHYLLCGLEAMPATIADILGIAASTVGGVVAAILLYRLAFVPPRRRTGPTIHQMQTRLTLRQPQPAHSCDETL
jgi:hypothetical protein